jgi:hypothetical protein
MGNEPNTIAQALAGMSPKAIVAAAALGRSFAYNNVDTDAPVQFDEAARAFLHQAEERVLEAERAEALSEISALMREADPEQLSRLSVLHARVVSARDGADLGRAREDLRSYAATAMNTDSGKLALMGREARKEQLWGRIVDTGKKLGEAMDEWLNDDEKKERERLMKALEEAKTEEERKSAWNNLREFDKRMLEREKERVDALPEGTEKEKRKQEIEKVDELQTQAPKDEELFDEPTQNQQPVHEPVAPTPVGSKPQPATSRAL